MLYPIRITPLAVSFTENIDSTTGVNLSIKYPKFRISLVSFDGFYLVFFCPGQGIRYHHNISFFKILFHFFDLMVTNTAFLFFGSVRQ